jgi:hypothetical protein
VDAVTAAQQEEQGGQLTVTVINPENIVDWHWGDNGEYTWLKVKAEVDLSGPLDEEKSSVNRYWYYTQEGWWYVDDNDERNLMVGASGVWDNGLPVVTWSMLDGTALTADASATQRELYNVNSLVQEQERETAFAMLGLPDPGEAMRAKVMQGGSDNVLWIDPVATNEPKWLTPDTAVLEHFMAKREALADEIMSALGLDFDEGGGQTGMAFQFKMSKIDRLIQGLAEAFSRSESRSLQRVGLELGSPVDEKVRVKWPKEFDARDVEKEQDAAERVLVHVGSAAAKEDAQYKIAIAGLGQQDEERRKLYRTQIEESVAADDLDNDNRNELEMRALEAATRGQPSANNEDADDLQADGGSR